MFTTGGKQMMTDQSKLLLVAWEYGPPICILQKAQENQVLL
jgi:hypothetical protein